ncbi:MAG: DUF222 domain-containing protein [Mycobacteriales bacterium]
MLDTAPPDVGFGELPSEIPEWMTWEAPLPEPPTCDCGCGPPEPVLPEEPVAWAVPGVTPFGAIERFTELPAVGADIAQLSALVDRLEKTRPADLPGAQALADGEALLELEQRLRVLNLRRIGDVAARGLHELVGFRSAKAWTRAHRPDGDAGDARLAAQLRIHSALQAAVEQGTVPLAAARKVALALTKVSSHVDRADGLIDGQPGDEVLPAVVQHVLALVCRHLLGLGETDPRLQELVDRAQRVLATGSQLEVLEGAFTWLAEQIPARQLSGPLDELVMALLPSELEERGNKGHARRGLSLTPLEDGSGWHVCGDLDLEAGERLWVALRAEAARDPRNPSDTSAWEKGRDNGDADLWGLGADLAGVEHPRGRAQRLHDALSRLLGRYLEQGLGGTHAKRPVQVSVTIPEAATAQRPGAPPPRAESGRLIPRGVVRRWWCDSAVTAYVMGLGGKALRAVHGQRTPSAAELRALSIESGGRCIGDGCCPDTPDLLVPLRPHHVLGFAENQSTRLDEIVPVCDTLHHDIHDGQRTVRLRDGRYLNERGFVDRPTLFDEPPF